MKPEPQLNTELKLAHNFLKQQYETYLNSNRIKSDNERRAYAHAIHTIQYIANNCNITKNTPAREYKIKGGEYYNTLYEE